MAKNNNLGDFLKGLADKFRSKLGTTVKINPQDFEGKVDEVYNKGKQEEYDAFWDEIQNYGNRINYESAFAYWGMEKIEPLYKTVPTSRTITMFNECKNLRIIEKKYFDLSQTSCNTNSSVNGNYATFAMCESLESFEDIGLKAGYYYRTFDNCRKLKTIEVLRSTKECEFEMTFNRCDALENITIDGVIGRNINFRYCPLSADSVYNILNHLDTNEYTGTRTITLKQIAKDNYITKYGETEWNNNIALFSNYGWTFAINN